VSIVEGLALTPEEQSQDVQLAHFRREAIEAARVLRCIRNVMGHEHISERAKFEMIEGLLNSTNIGRDPLMWSATSAARTDKQQP